MKNKNYSAIIKFSIIFIACIALMSLFYFGFNYILGKFLNIPSQGEAEAITKCLTDKGAKLYGASWCPHCKNQRAIFGESVQFLSYVECTEKAEECRTAGITAYPTWIINGEKYTGEKSFEQLKKISGC